MVPGKKFYVTLSLAGLMVIGMAAIRPAPVGPRSTQSTPAALTADPSAAHAADADGKPKRNLKVLPKDISHEDLDKVMDNWKAALGVKCNFCHAPTKDSNGHGLDFASDDKPEKEVARQMFKMTAKINKKYFRFDKDDKGSAPPVTCMTCHRGTAHPETK